MHKEAMIEKIIIIKERSHDRDIIDCYITNKNCDCKENL